LADQEIVPSYELEEVWVHVTRVPPGFRKYLVFWALGTVVGSTLDVDMLTNRKKGIVRVKVAILDKTQLPLTTDLVFGIKGYDISFTLEDVSFQPALPPAIDNDPMDHDDFGAEHGNSDDADGGAAAKKMKSDAEAPAPQARNDESGPTPMQLAVTPFGKNRPYPPMKPLVLMKKNDKLPLIGVTKPKSGFRSGPGSTNSKYHPILSPDRLRDFINHQSQISLHIAESPTHLVKEATSIPTPPAAPSSTE